jgi:DeoR/GlpR family transcriptional regulator of sugar metabolism
MLNVDRQRIILDQLYQNGSVKVSDLSNKLNVHEETIRRDLKSLAAKWDIELVYGGAVLKNIITTPAVPEINMLSKRDNHYDEKQIVAKKAASLIQPGETIGLNSGSTVEYILDYIEDKKPLNIVTLNVHIASKAILISGVDVYIPGGKLRTKSGAVIGAEASDFIRSFTIDKCFCGISAINLSKGICHPNIEEVSGNKAMLSASRQKYIVTDSSKVNQTALFKMFDIEEITGFVVDSDFPNEYQEYMELHGIDII